MLAASLAETTVAAVLAQDARERHTRQWPLFGFGRLLESLRVSAWTPLDAQLKAQQKQPKFVAPQTLSTPQFPQKAEFLIIQPSSSTVEMQTSQLPFSELDCFNRIAARFGCHKIFDCLRHFDANNQRRFSTTIVLAGGAVSGAIWKQTSSDLDVFFVGHDQNDANALLAHLEETLVSSSAVSKSSKVKPHATRNFTAVRSEMCTTLFMDHGTAKIQFIHRLYPTKASVIAGFDLGSSQVLVDEEKRVLFTTLGLFSHTYGVNLVDLTRLSPSYFFRVLKYMGRGFSALFPSIQITPESIGRTLEWDHSAHGLGRITVDWSKDLTPRLLVDMKKAKPKTADDSDCSDDDDDDYESDADSHESDYFPSNWGTDYMSVTDFPFSYWNYCNAVRGREHLLVLTIGSSTEFRKTWAECSFTNKPVIEIASRLRKGSDRDSFLKCCQGTYGDRALDFVKAHIAGDREKMDAIIRECADKAIGVFKRMEQKLKQVHWITENPGNQWTSSVKFRGTSNPRTFFGETDCCPIRIKLVSDERWLLSRQLRAQNPLWNALSDHLCRRIFMLAESNEYLLNAVFSKVNLPQMVSFSPESLSQPRPKFQSILPDDLLRAVFDVTSTLTNPLEFDEETNATPTPSEFRVACAAFDDMYVERAFPLMDKMDSLIEAWEQNAAREQKPALYSDSALLNRIFAWTNAFPLWKFRGGNGFFSSTTPHATLPIRQLTFSFPVTFFEFITGNADILILSSPRALHVYNAAESKMYITLELFSDVGTTSIDGGGDIVSFVSWSGIGWNVGDRYAIVATLHKAGYVQLHEVPFAIPSTDGLCFIESQPGPKTIVLPSKKFTFIRLFESVCVVGNDEGDLYRVVVPEMALSEIVDPELIARIRAVDDKAVLKSHVFAVPVRGTEKGEVLIDRYSIKCFDNPVKMIRLSPRWPMVLAADEKNEIKVIWANPYLQGPAELHLTADEDSRELSLGGAGPDVESGLSEYGVSFNGDKVGNGRPQVHQMVWRDELSAFILRGNGQILDVDLRDFQRRCLMPDNLVFYNFRSNAPLLHFGTGFALDIASDFDGPIPMDETTDDPFVAKFFSFDTAPNFSFDKNDSPAGEREVWSRPAHDQSLVAKFESGAPKFATAPTSSSDEMGGSFQQVPLSAFTVGDPAKLLTTYAAAAAHSSLPQRNPDDEWPVPKPTPPFFFGRHESQAPRSTSLFGSGANQMEDTDYHPRIADVDDDVSLFRRGDLQLPEYDEGYDDDDDDEEESYE